MSNFLTFMKRTFFFFGINLLIILTLNFILGLLMHYFQIEISNFYYYLIFYSIIGMGGAFISLLTSKYQAKKFMGVQIISKDQSDSRLRSVVQKVHHFSKKAGLPVFPEVGFYESPEVNAFATGPSKKNSLVAVSTGLLDHMNDEEMDGVLAHEVAHIANGDMVTMTLVQGVVNVMVMVLAYLIAQMVSQVILRGRRSWFLEFMLRSVFITLLYIPGSILVCFFSRHREYRADRGGARFAGREKMISALKALKQIGITGAQASGHSQQKKFNYLKISNNSKSSRSSFMYLFRSHPLIEDRIKSLQTPSIS